MHHPPLPPGPGLSLPVFVGALLRSPELLRPRPNRYLGRRVEPLAGERRPPCPSQAPSRPGSRRSGPDVGNPEMLEFALSQETARTAPLFPWWRAGRRIFGFCSAAGPRASGTHLLKKEQFPFPPGSQVHGMTVCDALLPHSRPQPISLARGDCCSPGKGRNRAGPSSREEAGVLQPLLHHTQETWWPSTNPGSASFEPGFTQAPVQDADAQAHYQMHPAPGLVWSDRREGCLLSCFDPSATQTVPTVCVRRSGMAVQGPPIRALPVSPCVHEGRRRRPYPVTGGECQDPQIPRRLAYPSPIQRAVGRSQGLGAPAPQPVGASGQLGIEQALPCAENLFSRCGVRLGEHDGTPHGGTCPSSAELPEFLQRQECGTTETLSEAPGAYGIRSCSHAARIASY